MEEMKRDIERIFAGELQESLRPKQLKPKNEFIGHA
jgi:hypothetical protein